MLTPQWCRIWDLNPYEFDSPEPKSGLSAIPAIRQTACFSCRHKLVLHHLFILAVGWQQTGEFHMTKKISNQVKLDLAAPVRLELTTHGLTVRRSNQLNYRAILIWFLCINIITYFLKKSNFSFYGNKTNLRYYLRLYQLGQSPMIGDEGLEPPYSGSTITYHIKKIAVIVFLYLTYIL